MTRDEFKSQIAEMEWRDVSRLQEEMMPLVYGLGGKFEVGEIDLHPDRDAVIVYGHYDGKRSFIRFTEGPADDHPSAWIEILLMKLPENVPEAFSREIERIKKSFGIEPVDRTDGFALGTTLSRATDADEVQSVYKHLCEHGQKLLPLLKEEEAPRPVATKASPVAPASPVARGNGVIIN